MNVKLLSMLGLLLCLATSCASILHGPKQSINFTSAPAGATIFIDGKEFGKTPQVISLNRDASNEVDGIPKKFFNVKIALDGYQPQELKLRRSMDDLFCGNIIFGGIIGMAIDASNGSMYKLSPSDVSAQMKETTAQVKTKKGQLFIAVVLKPQSNWTKIGQLKRK